MNEIGIKDQRFGVEVEFTGITRKEAAQALGAYLDGDRAWRFDKDSYEVNKKKKKHREEAR